MDRNHIEQTVLTILNTILGKNFEAGAEISCLNTLNWDSLKHIEIMFALEDELGIEFSTEELAHLDSMSKIIDTIMIKNAP